MKLFLSSYQISNAPEKLVELIGENKKVAIILNASDSYGDKYRPSYLARFTSEFADLGLFAEELDLRDFFYSNSELKKLMSNYGLIWATGGNTFALRWAMSKSGFDHFLPELLQQENLVYGGFSAGACVLSPTLRGIHLVDDIEQVPYSELQWEGLSLIDFCIAPHYQSNHRESLLIEDVVNYYEQNSMNYYSLRDGEALRIINNKIEKVGYPISL